MIPSKYRFVKLEINDKYLSKKAKSEKVVRTNSQQFSLIHK